MSCSPDCRALENVRDDQPGRPCSHVRDASAGLTRPTRTCTCPLSAGRCPFVYGATAATQRALRPSLALWMARRRHHYPGVSSLGVPTGSALSRQLPNWRSPTG